jgi:hypothetical protein
VLEAAIESGSKLLVVVAQRNQVTEESRLQDLCNHGTRDRPAKGALGKTMEAVLQGIWCISVRSW